MQAGILEAPVGSPDLTRAILADQAISEEQKQALVRIYLSFRREHEDEQRQQGPPPAAADTRRPPTPRAPPTYRRQLGPARSGRAGRHRLRSALAAPGRRGSPGRR